MDGTMEIIHPRTTRLRWKYSIRSTCIIIERNKRRCFHRQILCFIRRRTASTFRFIRFFLSRRRIHRRRHICIRYLTVCRKLCGETPCESAGICRYVITSGKILKGCIGVCPIPWFLGGIKLLVCCMTADITALNLHRGTACGGCSCCFLSSSDQTAGVHAFHIECRCAVGQGNFPLCRADQAARRSL